MGSSPYAHLVYGVNLDSEAAESLPWDPFNSGQDFDEWVESLVQLPVDPSAESELDWTDWRKMPGNIELYAQYQLARRAAIDTIPIEEVVYDSDNGDRLIAIRGTVNSADWNGAVEPVMTVTAQQIEAAKVFCAKHGIPFEDPKWLLIAEYG